MGRWLPGAGKDGELFNGDTTSIWDDEKFWNWTAVMTAQHCVCTWMDGWTDG